LKETRVTVKHGLQAALDTTKQFIALATGILTITITFADKFRGTGSDLSVPTTLEVAWILYVAVVLAGILTLMAITGTLDGIDKGRDGSANDSNIRVPALAMFISFLAAIAATVLAGFDVVR
jgi:hypothetical protein